MKQGQTVSTSLFFDKNETKAIIGQYVDTSMEPGDGPIWAASAWTIGRRKDPRTLR